MQHKQRNKMKFWQLVLRVTLHELSIAFTLVWICCSSAEVLWINLTLELTLWWILKCWNTYAKSSWNVVDHKGRVRIPHTVEHPFVVPYVIHQRTWAKLDSVSHKFNTLFETFFIQNSLQCVGFMQFVILGMYPTRRNTLSIDKFIRKVNFGKGRNSAYTIYNI